MGRLQEELEASMGPWSHRKGSGGGHLVPQAGLILIVTPFLLERL